MTTNHSWQPIINFWFVEIDPALWFKKAINFDQMIRDRFLATYWAATRCELYSWRTCAEGRLAEIIVLDQFSRNMFRELPQAFAFDAMAVTLAQEAIAGQFDQQLPLQKRKFLYMPLMHSESLVVHEQATELFSQPGLEDNYDYEIRHKQIIERFGRYPHRNQVLGRKSTPQEVEFLTQPGSSF